MAGIGCNDEVRRPAGGIAGESPASKLQPVLRRNWWSLLTGDLSPGLTSGLRQFPLHREDRAQGEAKLVLQRLEFAIARDPGAVRLATGGLIKRHDGVGEIGELRFIAIQQRGAPRRLQRSAQR